MRTVYIIVEGQTEEEFINNSLSDYLKEFGIINAVPVLLETSPGYFGGDISFARYQTNVLNLLKSDPNAIVTSLIDYFELRTDFPSYNDALAIPNKNKRMDFIEQKIAEVIANERFIPYIQLHEFEGLLFSDIRGFNYLTNIKAANKIKIEKIIQSYPNPELINDGNTTAPSIRLKGLIPRYKKTLHGPIIALENGMVPLLAKCPRFKNWIDLILAKHNTP
jgi:hypothetical protein